MTTVPPTTSKSLGNPTTDDDPDICGAELSDGGTCDRLVTECPYHSGDA